MNGLNNDFKDNEWKGEGIRGIADNEDSNEGVAYKGLEFLHSNNKNNQTLEDIVNDYISKVSPDKRKKLRLYEIMPNLGFNRLRPETTLSKIGNFVKKNYDILLSTGIILGMAHFWERSFNDVFQFYCCYTHMDKVRTLMPHFSLEKNILYLLSPILIPWTTNFFSSVNINPIKKAIKYGGFKVKAILGSSSVAAFLGIYYYIYNLSIGNLPIPPYFVNGSRQILYSAYKNLNSFSMFPASMAAFVTARLITIPMKMDTLSFLNKQFSSLSLEEKTSQINKLRELIKKYDSNAESGALVNLELDRALYVGKDNFKDVIKAFNKSRRYFLDLTPYGRMYYPDYLISFIEKGLNKIILRRNLKSARAIGPHAVYVTKVKYLSYKISDDAEKLHLLLSHKMRENTKKDLHELVNEFISKLRPYLKGIKDAKSIEHMIRFNSFLYPDKDNLPPEEVNEEISYLIKDLNSRDELRVNPKLSKGGKKIFVINSDFIGHSDSQIFIKSADEENNGLVNELRSEYYALRFMLRIVRNTEFYKNKTIPLFFGKTKINGGDVIALATSMIKGVPLPEYLRLFKNSDKLVLEQNRVIMHKLLRLSNLLTTHLNVLPNEELSAIKVMNLQDYTNKKLFVRLYDIFSYINKYFSPDLLSRVDSKKLGDKKMIYSLDTLINEFNELNPKSEYVINDSDAISENIICPARAEDKISEKNYYKIEKNPVIVDPRLELGSIVKFLYNFILDPRNQLKEDNQVNLANSAVRLTLKSKLFDSEKKLKQSFETYRTIADLTTAIMFMDYGIKKIVEKDFANANNFISKAHNFLLKLEPDKADKALYFKSELTDIQKYNITNFLIGIQPLKKDLIGITDVIRKEEIENYDRFLKNHS